MTEKETEKENPFKIHVTAGDGKTGSVKPLPTTKKFKPYSKLGGQSGAPSVSKEDFYERSLSLFRCVVTGERDRNVREVIILVEFEGKPLITSVVRIKPSEIPRLDKKKFSTTIKFLPFPVTAVKEKEKLGDYQFQAMLRNVFSLVDWETGMWFPGRSPFKDGEEERAVRLGDPVVQDLIKEDMARVRTLGRKKKKERGTKAPEASTTKEVK